MNHPLSKLLTGLIVCAGLTASTTALAGDIYSTVGKPGSLGWITQCPVPNLFNPPNNIDNLDTCDPATANCLQRVTIDTSVHTEATCNDGSPGTFYIRPGQNGDEDKWIVHLQGGSLCKNADECLDRWCGAQGIYNANKMSTNWYQNNALDLTAPTYAQASDLPKFASAGGIFRDDSSNTFKDWTHVWVYYCSSDNWGGQVADVSYTASGGQTYTIDHQGHNILKAVRKMLRQTTALGSNEISDDYQYLPDIDTASHVVFTGTSAGAYGAMQHADWFFTPLATNVEQKHYLVLDAAMEPTKAQAINHNIEIDLAGTIFTYGQWRKDTETAAWSAGGYYDNIDAFIDVSCKNAYTLAQRHKCSAGGRLLAADINHISTPTFIRYDLEDNTMSKPWTGGFPGLEVLRNTNTTTMDDHILVLNDSLVELYDDTNSVTGVFAPRCGNHVGLEKNNPFQGHVTAHYQFSTIPPFPMPVYGPVAGSESNFEQALYDWLNLSDAAPSPLIVVDSKFAAITSSACDPAP